MRNVCRRLAAEVAAEVVAVQEVEQTKSQRRSRRVPTHPNRCPSGCTLRLVLGDAALAHAHTPKPTIRMPGIEKHLRGCARMG